MGVVAETAGVIGTVGIVVGTAVVGLAVAIVVGTDTFVVGSLVVASGDGVVAGVCGAGVRDTVRVVAVVDGAADGVGAAPVSARSFTVTAVP